MKLLFDQNISFRIIGQLPEEFSSSTSVKKVYLLNATDKEVWDYAKKNGYVIVTQDSDFNDLSFLYGAPPKIIWIRSGNLKTSEIADIIIEYKNDLEAFLGDDNHACFEIFRINNQ
ncbi:MAG: DUF5615 family PIN-like protein [Lentimicrobium sp.]